MVVPKVYKVQPAGVRQPAELHVRHIDASIMKDWALCERMKLQFRTEAFIAPNHAN